MLSLLSTALAQVDTAWVRRYNHIISGDEYDYTIVVNNEGNIYVAGGSGSPMGYLTIKYNPAGEEVWVVRYNGAGNTRDGATAIAVDAESNVYVSGTSWDSNTYNDYTTIKYLSGPGVKEGIGSRRLSYGLKLYPNPARSQVHLHIPAQDVKEVKIYDVSGKLVKTLPIVKNQKPVTIPLTGMATGAYFLRIGNETAKLIVKAK